MLTSKVDSLSSLSSDTLYQHLEEERLRKQNTKNYYIIRINSYYEIFLKEYEEYKSVIENYRGERNPSNWEKVVRYGTDFSNQVDTFSEEATWDIKPVLPLLNNPRLADKFSLMISLTCSQLKGLLLKNNWESDQEILSRVQTMSSAVNTIKQFMDDLNKEKT